jgi:hypothetical protein
VKSVTAGPAMKNEPDSAEAVALYTAFVALSAGGLRSYPGYFKRRSPILDKQTVESPYGTIVWQI